MRRLIAIGALALLVLAVVPLTAGSAAVTTKHVDGAVKVFEPRDGGREWLARFEVRTTSDVVDFGYLRLLGVSGTNAGEIHEFSVYDVDYYRTDSGARGATLWMEECIVLPPTPCFPVDYRVSDGGSTDTFLANLNWEVESGNISIYTTGGQNTQ